VRTIKVRLCAEDLSREMAAMREWLDYNSYEPRRFNCDKDRDTVVLSVDFMVDAAADAFAVRFDGKIEPSPSSAPGGTTGTRDRIGHERHLGLRTRLCKFPAAPYRHRVGLPDHRRSAVVTLCTCRWRIGECQ
jgi:hypothetical protein